MASSSASSINHSKPSRFSTLKVFKFSSSRDKDSKPPPLPPKDPYYLQNRSLASLSPDTLSIPPHSPLSPHSQYYARRPSPDMNQSSMSLVSSAASARSFSPADPPPPAAKNQKKDKASRFLKFTRRSPKAPPPGKGGSSDDVPPPEADDGISLPWNFQHNIHVDEVFTGLPPSWTTSLAQAGFTEDEIADIQNRRRAGARSPGSHYLYTERPASPAYSLSGPPLITNPTPRTTSLPRQFSDASLRSGTRRPPQPPLVTTLVTSPSNGSLQSNRPPGQTTISLRQNSGDQSSLHQSASSISLSYDSHHSSNSVVNFDQDTMSRALGTALPTSESTHPSTPPRRTYHVANELPIMNSPPPSYTHYSSTNGNIYSADKKDGAMFNQASSSTYSTPRSNSTTSKTTALSTSPETVRQGSPSSQQSLGTVDELESLTILDIDNSPTKSRARPRASSLSKRLTALPPRLSLHKANDSTDLSTWGEALLSGMSTAADITPNSSTFATSQESKSRGEPVASTSRRQPPPTRPLPPSLNPPLRSEQSTDSDGEEDPPSSGWAEPASTARHDPLEQWNEQPTPSSEAASPLWSALENVVRNEPTEEKNYGSSLNETFSPTIPSSSRDGVESMIKGRYGLDNLREDGYEGFLTADGGVEKGVNRNSSRSSTSTVTGLTEQPAIVRNVSIARRAGAYVIDKSKVASLKETREAEGDNAVGVRHTAPRASSIAATSAVHPPSPLSSNFGSEEGSASGSGSSSSLSQDHQTPTTDAGLDSPLLYYLDSSPSPDPSKLSFSPAAHHHLLVSTTDTFGGIHKEDAAIDDIGEDEDVEYDTVGVATVPRPTIIISGAHSASPSTGVTSGTTPSTPFQRYRGWLSTIVAPLEEFIDEAIDPREYYLDLHEIAEGESGSVFAARLAKANYQKLKLPPLIKAQDSDDLGNERTKLVAIKSIAILPSGSPKLVDLERELSLMKGLWHGNILSMDAVYVDLVEDALWIRMELMEMSLADIIGLTGEGLVLQDRMIARFASDIILALEYLQKHLIAHRDVRSDNLLINSKGVLKLSDFSNAVKVAKESHMQSDIAGVLYWQAPEVRTPPYNALKVDVWSLGATIWEMAEAEPPFAETQQISDRWPPLTRPEIYSPGFHDFLRQCSEPPASRPSPSTLRKTSFIHNACGRPVIVQLLTQCMAIEKILLEGETSQ